MEESVTKTKRKHKQRKKETSKGKQATSKQANT
jgi:hypothetical protein